MLVVASRYNEAVTHKLLEGASETLRQEGIGESDVTIVWVPGAFELPVAVHVGLATGKYDLAVALGAVIRGDTAHFEYVAGEATRGLGSAATRFGLPVGFGLLTCDTMQQALDRAGGDRGNKGSEAAAGALAAAEVLDGLRDVAES